MLVSLLFKNVIEKRLNKQSVNFDWTTTVILGNDFLRHITKLSSFCTNLVINMSHLRINFTLNFCPCLIDRHTQVNASWDIANDRITVRLNIPEIWHRVPGGVQLSINQTRQIWRQGYQRYYHQQHQHRTFHKHVHTDEHTRMCTCVYILAYTANVWRKNGLMELAIMLKWIWNDSSMQTSY